MSKKSDLTDVKTLGLVQKWLILGNKDNRIPALIYMRVITI